MTYYDFVNLCYFYVAFRKKGQKYLFSIYIQLLFYDTTLFFQSIWEKHLNCKGIC